jgi:hypothetical protein
VFSRLPGRDLLIHRKSIRNCQWSEDCYVASEAEVYSLFSRRAISKSIDVMLRDRQSALPAASPARMHVGSDAADLTLVAAALAELSDCQLCALIDTIDNVPQIVPGLLAWIGHACDWELNRRACVELPLQSPDMAIPPEEDALSIAAMMTLRMKFNRDARGDAGVVVALFDAIIRVLTGGERRH